MPNGPYREASHAPSKRRVEADETIGAADAKVGPLLLLFVPAELRERIGQLRGGGEDASDDDRVALAEALQEAIAIGEERDHDLHVLPTQHPEAPRLDDPWGHPGTDSAAAPLLKKAHCLAQDIDGDADVTCTGPRITARIRKHATPILWSIDLRAPVILQAGGDVLSFAAASHWMATCVSEDTPKIFLRGEGIADKTLKALRLRTEVEIGNTAFDDAFFVDGDECFVRALMTRELRNAFVERADAGEFTFLLDGSTASLAWKGGLPGAVVTERPFLHSVDVLLALRAALGRLRLLPSA